MSKTINSTVSLNLSEISFFMLLAFRNSILYKELRISKIAENHKFDSFVQVAEKPPFIYLLSFYKYYLIFQIDFFSVNIISCRIIPGITIFVPFFPLVPLTMPLFSFSYHPRSAILHLPMLCTRQYSFH